jgi:hypothetical protein
MDRRIPQFEFFQDNLHDERTNDATGELCERLSDILRDEQDNLDAAGLRGDQITISAVLVLAADVLCTMSERLLPDSDPEEALQAALRGFRKVALDYRACRVAHGPAPARSGMN